MTLANTLDAAIELGLARITMAGIAAKLGVGAETICNRASRDDIVRFAALRLANPAHRKGFILWQVLGITDLVNALAMGTLAGVIDPHGVPTGAMTVLPMSYIPTFAVPLFLILHIICIAQARRWPATRFAATGNSFTTPMPQGQE